MSSASMVILKDVCIQVLDKSVHRPYFLKMFLLSGIEPYFAYLETVTSVKTVIVESRYYSVIIRTIDENIQIYVPKNLFRTMSFNFGLYARSVVINAEPDRYFIDGLRRNNRLEELDYNWHNKKVFYSIISKPRYLEKLTGRDYILRMLLHRPITSKTVVVRNSNSWKLIPIVRQFSPVELSFINCDNTLNEVAEIIRNDPSFSMTDVRKFSFETRRIDLDENLIHYLRILKRVFPKLEEISIVFNSLSYMAPPESLQLLIPTKLKEFFNEILNSSLDSVKICLDFRRFLYLGVVYNLDFIPNYGKQIRQLFRNSEVNVDGKLGIVASGDDGNVFFKIDLRVEPASYVVYSQS